MNEKERILDLVKNNVITLEEALELLEASQLSTKASSTTAETTDQTHDASTTQRDTTSMQSPHNVSPQMKKLWEKGFETGKAILKMTNDVMGDVVDEMVSEFSKEFNLSDRKKTASDQTTTYADEYKEAQDQLEKEIENHRDTQQDAPTQEKIAEQKETLKKAISEKKAHIQQLSDTLSMKTEAHTIAKQRVREFEILAELDDLTVELADQKHKLQVKLDELTAEISQIEADIETSAAELEALYKQKYTYKKEEFNQFVTEASEQVTQKANEFSESAIQNSRSLGHVIFKGAKVLAKSIGQNAKVLVKYDKHDMPYAETGASHISRHFNAQDINEIKIDVFSGNVSIEAVEREDVVLTIDSMSMHSLANDTLAQFNEMSVIDLANGKLTIKVQAGSLNSDVYLALPQKLMHLISINSHDDITLSNIKVKDLELETDNGDTKLKAIQAAFLNMTLSNGEVTILDSDIDDTVIKHLNGDIRLKGNLGNLSIDTVNSDVYLTKMDLDPSVIKVHTVTGSIKVAVPSELNLESVSQSTVGEVKSRLTNTLADTNGKLSTHTRQLNTDAALVKLDLSTTVEDIYLKNTDI